MEAAGITQSPKRVALVTGSNKGIGLEICRQLASNGVMVILTARDENQGLEAVQNLKTRGQSDILFHQLDVTNQTSIASLAEFIKTKFKKLDILVNNAGVSGTMIDPAVQKGLNLRVFDDIAGPEAKKLKEVLNESWEVAEACLRTNYYGVKLVTEELIPLLQLSDSPRIVNVSSILGQLKLISNEKAKKELSDIESLTVEKVDELVQEFAKDLKEDKLEARGWPNIFSAYIVSKAALNGYTRVLAKNYPNIAINAVSPGYVKTDLNHNNGILTVEQGAKGPVMLALVDDVVIGDQKGKGIELCRLASNEILVILRARDVRKGSQIYEYQASGLSNVEFQQLDVKDPAIIASPAVLLDTYFRKLYPYIRCNTGNLTPEEGARVPVMLEFLLDDGPLALYFDEMYVLPFK
ncbi:hypothetical protein RHGRI_005800 [Rhododendron griersonianum]|uniref:Salutaridine reductase n=1 Tax=Rhododendron griersonianum TaxID=479676 RepID=A0AAV6LET3_9ERIC|nr:hypothetical protein RHGRI_005800 [Rhododendron griersonianum]